MPRFLHSKSALLNDLAAPKKRVTKNLKKTYQGTESTIGQKLEETEAFDGVYTKMVGVIASLNEINNQLTLVPTASKTSSGAVGRYILATSAVLTKLKDLLLFFSRNVSSMSIFNAQQIEQLNGLNSQLVSELKEIEANSQDFTPLQKEKFAKVTSVFARDLVALQQILQGQQTPEAVYNAFASEFATIEPLGPNRRRSRAEEVAAVNRARVPPATYPIVSGRGYSPQLNDLIGGAFPSNLLAKPLIGSNPNTWTPLQYRSKVDVGLPMGGYTPTRFL